LKLGAYLLDAYLTREKISGSWQGMQQAACHDPPGTMAAGHCV